MARRAAKASSKAKKKASKAKSSAAKKTAAKTAKPPKITAANKPRTKSEVLGLIAAHVGISKKEAAAVFEVLGDIVSKDLSKSGPGVVNVAGLMKVTVKRIPARKARKGIDPFTKEERMFKAKPAQNRVKIRPLKALKDKV